ncbi:hypothetical protein Tco_0678940 [Tanacetum coccineum]|uniref:Translocon at the inner envelope membrane of chloroplasts 214 n=1 Tax=Tanacetum coccineum TaxID=301880 RepID=A0ABQ4XGG6_9ASTR
MVRSNIGGEYVFLFLNLCAKLRIRHKFITLDTPTRELLKEKKSVLENMVNAMFLRIGRSSRIDDEVVQDKRQRDDNNLQDVRQDQSKEEEVEPRSCKRLRTE